MSRNTIIVLIYHYHKLLVLIYEGSCSVLGESLQVLLQVLLVYLVTYHSTIVLSVQSSHHLWENLVESCKVLFFWGIMLYSQKMFQRLEAGFLLGLLFSTEDGGNMFLWNTTWLSVDCVCIQNVIHNFQLVIMIVKIVLLLLKNLCRFASLMLVSDFVGIGFSEFMWLF
jgi:hypothetical protein